jgi:hypothetical protein
MRNRLKLSFISLGGAPCTPPGSLRCARTSLLAPLRSRLWIVLVAICASLAFVAQPKSGAGGNHVVIITLDGFPGWALDDPYVPAPTLRRLAARGAVAAGMRPVNPTVTWPNHTTIVTGVTPAKHRVLFNGTLVRDPGVPPRVEPWRDKKDMVHVPTLYDAVHDRGMKTAQVDWVAILNAASIDWEFPERPERPETKRAIAQEMVKAPARSLSGMWTDSRRRTSCGGTRSGLMPQFTSCATIARICSCSTF